jgi:hypothetical protein
VGSDIFSVSVSYLAGNTGLASALLATVLLSMSFQILVVVFVHRHHGPGKRRRLMLEILFVVTGVKPFVDVWRILAGKANVGAPIDTKAERVGCKVTAHPDARPPRGNEALLRHGLLDRHVVPLHRNHPS